MSHFFPVFIAACQLNTTTTWSLTIPTLPFIPARPPDTVTHNSVHVHIMSRPDAHHPIQLFHFSPVLPISAPLPFPWPATAHLNDNAAHRRYSFCSLCRCPFWSPAAERRENNAGWFQTAVVKWQFVHTKGSITASWPLGIVLGNLTIRYPGVCGYALGCVIPFRDHFAFRLRYGYCCRVLFNLRKYSTDVVCMHSNNTQYNNCHPQLKFANKLMIKQRE